MTFLFDPAPPQEAWAFWKDKVPMSKKAFNQLAEGERVRAFIVGGMAKADMLTAMHRSIDKAIETGQPITAWKDEISALFEQNGWKTPEPWRLDNIFRTNIQTAYNVGRYKQMMDVVEDRPYWRYSAVNDRRTRLSHAALHGKVVRADDPFWGEFYPPNGFRCRCTVSCLSDGDMRRRGYEAEAITPGQPLEIKLDNHPHKGRVVPVMPDNNFQFNAGKEYWQADTGRYRADVKQMLLKDISKACPEEFCGPCEFAETDCYECLKRHLTQEDLEDLQTVVWAEGEKVKQGFGKWVDGVIGSMQEKGTLYPVGALPARFLNTFEKQPRLALVTVDDKQIINLARPPKQGQGAAIPGDEIKQIPERMAVSDWFPATDDPEMIVTWLPAGNQWIKVLVNLDYRVGKKKNLVTNHIIMAVAVRMENL